MKNKLTFILLTVGPLAGIILATLGLFKLVGVTYKNNMSLFVFLLFYLFIEFVIDNILELLASDFNNTYWMNFLRVSLALYVSDRVIDSISIGTLTIFILALIFTLFEFMLNQIDDDDLED